MLAAGLALAGCAAGSVAPENLTVAQIQQVCGAFEGLDEQRTIDEPSAMVVRYGRERGICPLGNRELVELQPGVFISVTEAEAQLACDVAPWIELHGWRVGSLMADMLQALAQESAERGLCGSARPVQWSTAQGACGRVKRGQERGFEDALLALAAASEGLCS
jgi:hypothetical protein